MEIQTGEASVGISGISSDISADVERFLQACTANWPVDHGRPHVLARSPGRLDCMGGMADFSGALALQMPIDRAAYVCCGQRDDLRVRVESIGRLCPDDSPVFEWPLSLFYDRDGKLTDAQDFSAYFENCPWVRHVAGVLYACLKIGALPHLSGGITIIFESTIPIHAGLASSAAIQVATAQAVTGLFEVELQPEQLLEVCRLADRLVVCNEADLVDHATCLLGESDALLQIRCQPQDVLGPLSLPKDVTLLGVNIKSRQDIYQQRHADNRVAALLGKHLIEKVLRSSGESGDPIGGYLANISPSEYVRRFRNELPVKVKGKDFSARFGEPPAECARHMVSDRVYKIRSRTEHHIYENDRTHRFMERLSRARRTGERDALVEAGELLYASHWSYGQRCGMASIEADAMVNFIRERGAARGLYGAKVTGGGCGGTIAVMMARTPQAEEALSEACQAYTQKTGLTPGIIAGSSPGARLFGIRSLDSQL